MTRKDSREHDDDGSWLVTEHESGVVERQLYAPSDEYIMARESFALTDVVTDLQGVVRDAVQVAMEAAT